MKKENIVRIVCGTYQENAYLVCPDGRSTAFFVDPGDDLPALRRALDESGRTLEAILLTHGHFDHMLGAQPLIEETGAGLYIAAEDAEMLDNVEYNAYDPDVSALDAPHGLASEDYPEVLNVCGEALTVLRTPGHSAGSVCLYDPQGKILFSGDTLFRMGYGRTDLHGGSYNRMGRSLRMLLGMDEDVLVLSGHGEETTIGNERRRYRL